ncbi:MAG TPA: hypothetical protein VGF82_28390 [Terracidiphilus sp.]
MSASGHSLSGKEFPLAQDIINCNLYARFRVSPSIKLLVGGFVRNFLDAVTGSANKSLD